MSMAFPATSPVPSATTATAATTSTNRNYYHYYKIVAQQEYELVLHWLRYMPACAAFGNERNIR